MINYQFSIKQMNETLQTIKARRSVRAYTEQQVSAEDLNLILEAAAYAPNGMHLETWHFTAIQNKEVLKELNDKIKGAFAKSDNPHTRERGHSQTYCCYYHAPTLVIVSNEPTQCGLLWIAPALWRMFSLPPSPSASVPVGLINWGRRATTPMSVLS